MENIRNSLTIFTPTYNREDLLPRLYQSLIIQDDLDFIWLIVDDGSTDQTREFVKKIQSDRIIEIDYYYQKNSGKHIAHNLGVMLCDSELFVCVDSDDLLLPDTVSQIKLVWESVKEKPNVCGIVSPRQMENTLDFNKAPNFGTLSDLYNKYGFKGETMLVYRSSIIKRFLFPCIANEKFLQEKVIYSRIDQNHIYRYFNEKHYISEYIEDGLTFNKDRIRLSNPLSTLYVYKNDAIYQSSIIRRIRAYGNFLSMKKDEQINECFPELKVNMFIIIPGLVYSIYKNTRKNNNKRI